VTPTGSETTTKAGYALGAGVEYAFLSNWSAKIEYLYVHLADGNCNVPCGSPVPPIDVKFNTSLVRAGLNYKFSGPVF
jgi:outer membrane immunogenic protein